MKKKTGKNQKKNNGGYEGRNFSAYSFDAPQSEAEASYLRIRQSSIENSDKYTKTEVRRRQNKKRKIKNKARRVLITLTALIAFVAIVVTLSLTIFFKTTDIKVTGSGIYTAEEIASHSTIELGKNLFLINTDECISALTKDLPYIYEVKITRELPATVQIEITDATPFLAIDSGNGLFVLIDDRLKVLDAAAPEQPADVIMITNTAVSAAIPGERLAFEDEDTEECITSLVEAVKAVGMSEATSISSVDKNNNYIVYNGRITFKLGNCNNLEGKINRGLAVCEELNEHNDSIRGTVNLTVEKQSYFTEE